MNEANIVSKLETVLSRLELMNEKLNTLQGQVENIKLRQANIDRRLDDVITNQKTSYNLDMQVSKGVNRLLSTLPPGSDKPENKSGNEQPATEAASANSTPAMFKPAGK